MIVVYPLTILGENRKADKLSAGGAVGLLAGRQTGSYSG